MMRRILTSLLFVCGATLCAQTDSRPVVGVAQFTCETDSRFVRLVTEKVVEMLTNTRRFQVVDRTSSDRVREELELQRSEAFMDSHNLVEQDVAIAAEKLITGHINKIPVYAIKDGMGRVKGFKASVSFQMKVVDVATGLSTEATSFEGKAGDLMLSPESAVTQAMQTLQGELDEYFRVNFPIVAKIVKVTEEDASAVKTVVLNAGKRQGIKKGDLFRLAAVEILEGEALPTDLGEVEVKELSGESFSICTVARKPGRALKEKLAAGVAIECRLVVGDR